MGILFVENDPVFASVVVAEFLAGHEVKVIPSVNGASSMAPNSNYEAVLVDYDLDGGKGTQVVAPPRQ